MLEPQRLVRPLHAHFCGTRLVAFLDNKLDKLRLVKLGAYNDILPLTDIDADTHDKLGISS